ncbi:acyltransferase [Mucilaginibacter ximonensis]|uniref:Acyltransferase n=1 Tax=Mucilaginibacter ximonensis TaxID=538021 RepID=A0ABW5YEX2_9SPHI
MFNLLKTEIKKWLFKRRLKQIRQYITAGNSLFWQQFDLVLVKPEPGKKYLQVGDDTVLDCRVVFETSAGRVIVGNNTFIGSSTIICRSKIEFENDIFVAWGTCFYDHDSHSVDYRHREADIRQQLIDHRNNRNFIENKNWDVVNSKPIKICSNAWIGMNCIILKGVTIGEGAIVGAGSVVTKDVAPWTVVGGNPAKMLKELPENLRKK